MLVAVVGNVDLLGHFAAVNRPYNPDGLAPLQMEAQGEPLSVGLFCLLPTCCAMPLLGVSGQKRRTPRVVVQCLYSALHEEKHHFGPCAVAAPECQEC